LTNIRDGELLLVDSGCEYNGYSSDTTRVWPVNGKFKKAQRELYDVMLNIQKNCIKVKYGNFEGRTVIVV
jgi:Xaa-Pro aminopeptidase